MTNIFDLENVSFDYDGIVALRQVSLSIASGQRVAIVGANGSGKSTLLRLLDGLCFPSSGTVRFSGEAMTPERLQSDGFALNFRRRVALVFQNPDVQLFNPTVFDELAFGPLQLRWPKDQLLERMNNVMEFMGITNLRDRPPHRLSGGEKKRVALASVLVLDPEVLLLDEPTSALDPKTQSHLIDLIQSWKSTTKTVIAATHQLDIVEDIAKIKLKRIYDLDAPKGVMGRNSDNTLIKKYLGWEPDIPLRQGMEKTYAWIYDQFMARAAGRKHVVA